MSRKKARFFPKFSLKTVFFMVLAWSWNQNKNQNLSKIGTRTVKNSYGSATLVIYNILVSLLLPGHM
jgi:hypothetical protein